MNVLNIDSSVEGGFEKGDAIERILYAKRDIQSGGVLLSVLWRTRPDGILPKPTLVLNSVF